MFPVNGIELRQVMRDILYHVEEGKNIEKNFIDPEAVPDAHYYYALDEVIKRGYIQVNFTKTWNGKIILRDRPELTRRGTDFIA